MKSMKQNSENEFTVNPELATKGFWITVGKSSVYIKNGDMGVEAALYPLDKEDRAPVAYTYASNDDLTAEPDEIPFG